MNVKIRTNIAFDCQGLGRVNKSVAISRKKVVNPIACGVCLQIICLAIITPAMHAFNGRTESQPTQEANLSQVIHSSALHSQTSSSLSSSLVFAFYCFSLLLNKVFITINIFRLIYNICHINEFIFSMFLQL